jgi:hypothetical protein
MLDIEPRDKSKDENEEQPNKSEESKSDSTEATTTPNSKLNDTDVGVSKT